jgi:hypothetical protein
LRHLQTLLALARDRRNGLEHGPYAAQGRLLRYYRALHQVDQHTAQELYRTDVTHEGMMEAELGRARIADRAKILGIAAAIGVPRVFEQEFADALWRGYEAVFRKISGPAERAVEDFPNPVWSIPYNGLSNEEVEARFLSFRDEGSVRSRGALALRAGLRLSQAHALSLQGTLWAVVRERELQDGNHPQEARRLRVLRAVHELRRKPVGDRAGYHKAGRLLRFTRLMMPGRAAEDVIKTLKLDMRTPAYTYWEWGLAAMPGKILNSYADLLAAEGVFPDGTQASFLEKLQKIYGR